MQLSIPSPTSRSSHHDFTMVIPYALLLVGVFCITDGFVLSVTPNVDDKFSIRSSGIRRGGRRPLLLPLGYRRLADSNYGNATEDITKARRIPALDELRQIDNTSDGDSGKGERRRRTVIKRGVRRNTEAVPFGFDADNNKDDDSSLNARLQQLVGHQNATTKGALIRELSSLMDGIEQLSQEVDETKSIPPYLSVQSSTSLEWNEMVTRTTTRNYGGDASRAKDDKNEVKTVQDLRQAVLDEGMELREIQLSEEAQLLVNATAEQLLNHDVVELMVQRFKTGSTPGNRAPEDKARLALAIEGGGKAQTNNAHFLELELLVWWDSY